MVMRGRTHGRLAAAVTGAVFILLCVYVCIDMRQRNSTYTFLRSTQYWSQYYQGDASPYPTYGSAHHTGYPSYSAFPMGRRPSYYNSDVTVEEAVGLPVNTDDLNFLTKDGKEAVARLVDVIASVAFKKEIKKIKDEDRNKITITDITPMPAVYVTNQLYPKKRKEGVRVDFSVQAPNSHAADLIIGLLSANKLTKALQQVKIWIHRKCEKDGEKYVTKVSNYNKCKKMSLSPFLLQEDKKKKIKAEKATILSVTTSAFATPIYDDNQTWGQENATQHSAYAAYLKSFYRSASADRSRWPWLDNHMLFNVLGGNNGYDYSAADAALDQGLQSTEKYGKARTIAFNDLSSDLQDSSFYGSGGSGGGLRHGDDRSSLLVSQEDGSGVGSDSGDDNQSDEQGLSIDSLGSGRVFGRER